MPITTRQELLQMLRVPEACEKYPEFNKTEGLFDLIDENLDKNSTILEIGTGRGVSTQCFAISCKEVHTVDPNMLKEWRRSAHDLYKYNNVFMHGSLTFLLKNCLNIFDFAYIDGLHDEVSIKKDIETVKKLLKKNALIGGHDYMKCRIFHVDKVVNELFGSTAKIYKDSSWIARIS